jgi:hypothetical protein
MKFIIELGRVTGGGAFEVLYRLSIVAMSPKLAKFAAENLIGSAKARGANCVRSEIARAKSCTAGDFDGDNLQIRFDPQAAPGSLVAVTYNPRDPRVDAFST